MHPIDIIVSFFAVLAGLIAGAVLPQKKPARVFAGVAAFGWACLMFMAARWAQGLNHNAWYSDAASRMLEANIGDMEQRRQEAVLAEMRRMTNGLEVTYEHRGNFKQLAERAAKSLMATNAEPTRSNSP